MLNRLVLFCLSSNASLVLLVRTRQAVFVLAEATTTPRFARFPRVRFDAIFTRLVEVPDVLTSIPSPVQPVILFEERMPVKTEFP